MSGRPVYQKGKDTSSKIRNQVDIRHRVLPMLRYKFEQVAKGELYVNAIEEDEKLCEET